MFDLYLTLNEKKNKLYTSKCLRAHKVMTMSIIDILVSAHKLMTMSVIYILVSASIAHKYMTISK